MDMNNEAIIIPTAVFRLTGLDVDSIIAKIKLIINKRIANI